MAATRWTDDLQARLIPDVPLSELAMHERVERAQLTAFMRRTLQRIDARNCAGLTDPSLPLRTESNAPPGGSVSRSGRPMRVACVPITGDPPTLGHVALALYAHDTLECDATVLLAHGRALHKVTASNTEEDVRRRHDMLRAVADQFVVPHALVRYSDVSRSTSALGEAAIHELIRLNQEQDIDWYLVFGEDSSRDRVDRIVANVVHAARQHRIGRNIHHTIALAFISRGPRLSLNEAAIIKRLATAGLQDTLLRLVPPYPALHRISSTRFRETHRPHLLPRPVLEYLHAGSLSGVA